MHCLANLMSSFLNILHITEMFSILIYKFRFLSICFVSTGVTLFKFDFCIVESFWSLMALTQLAVLKKKTIQKVSIRK